MSDTHLCKYYDHDSHCQEPASLTGLCAKHESEYQQYVERERLRHHLLAQRLCGELLERLSPKARPADS